MASLNDYLGHPAPSPDFGDILATADRARTGAIVRTANRLVLGEYLTDISGDPTGTPLEELLAPAQVDTARQFLTAAESRGWPNAQEISMYVKPGRQRLAWNKPRDMPGDLFGSPGGMLPHTRMRPLDMGGGRTSLRGYIIGALDMQHRASHHPVVVLCEDGTLRCHRNPHVFRKSYGLGWGRVPDFNDVVLRLNVDPDAPAEFGQFLAKYLVQSQPTNRPQGWLARLTSDSRH